MRRDPVAAEGLDASGPASPVVAAEAEDVIDPAEQRLIDAFGPVTRWWVGELPGLGIQRLPLP